MGVNRRAAEGASKTLSKMPKIYQNLDFNQLKTVYNVLKLGIFPIFDDIFTANILETWEKRGGALTSMRECSSIVSRYHNYICKNLLKIDDND